ncbi:MAG: type II secretion system protein, partial [Vulcanimicrobiota bacterium]
MKRQKGFSIIDGIFILAIVVLLSSIVVPHVQKARAHNQLEICVNNIKEMVTGINLYKSDHPEFSGTIICSNSNPSPELVPDYISSIPT